MNANLFILSLVAVVVVLGFGVWIVWQMIKPLKSAVEPKRQDRSQSSTDTRRNDQHAMRDHDISSAVLQREFDHAFWACERRRDLNRLKY